MAANVESLSTLERRVSMSVAVDQIEREVDQRLKQLARNVKMPGFRPGKVPLKLVAQQGAGLAGDEVPSRAASGARRLPADRTGFPPPQATDPW